MAKATTDERAATPADRAPESLTPPSTVTDTDVARRAYDLYLARGCEHGRDVDDWLEAEREVRGAATQ